ncbi:MAG: htrB [Acidobacteria bacterium]|nr:htrB [Acidobacteriota bacterium]
MSRKKSRFVQRVEYVLYRGVAALVRAASEERVYRWGGGLGTLARRVLRKRDRLAMTNLRATFPERDEASLRATLNDCWRHFGREVLGYLRIQQFPLEEIAKRCRFVNPEVLSDAIARGNGTVLISAHYGGWEVAGLALLAHVDNVRTVARRLDNEILERDLARFRATTGAEVIDRRKAARPLMQGLADNAVIVLLPDQAVLPREGVRVPFLGRPAWTTAAPAKMALRHESTIVFGFCIPDGLGHRLEFDESIRVDELSESERDPVALTTRINGVISRRIAARPELWLWMHDRWKGNATGEGETNDAG